jgi:hypothetical protein
MRHSYLIAFNQAFAGRQAITEHLDKIGPTWDWNAVLPNCVFFTSPLSAGTLAKSFEEAFGTDGGKMFVIIKVDGIDSQGRLSERAWRVVNNPNNPRGT